MARDLRARRAFTLLECGVVFVVLGILAGIGAFAYTTHVNAAYDVAARTVLSDLSRQAVASLLYDTRGSFAEDGSDVTRPAGSGSEVSLRANGVALHVNVGPRSSSSNSAEVALVVADDEVQVALRYGELIGMAIRSRSGRCIYGVTAHGQDAAVWDGRKADLCEAAGALNDMNVTLLDPQREESDGPGEGDTDEPDGPDLPGDDTSSPADPDPDDSETTPEDDEGTPEEDSSPEEGGDPDDNPTGPGEDDIVDYEFDEFFSVDAKEGCLFLPVGSRIRIDGVVYTVATEGTAGNDVLYAGHGNGKPGNGKGSAHGLAGHDILCGGNGKDSLYGGPGDDILAGGNGQDLLDGGPGDDRLYGGNGKDTLLGGPGDDELYGGQGPDTLIDDEGHNILVQ